jgi:hypothetical protein
MAIPSPKLLDTKARHATKKGSEIPVTDLRIGMVIAEGSGVKVRTLTPCTQRDRVHVNDSMCYEYSGKVHVR